MAWTSTIVHPNARCLSIPTVPAWPDVPRRDRRVGCVHKEGTRPATAWKCAGEHMSTQLASSALSETSHCSIDPVETHSIQPCSITTGLSAVCHCSFQHLQPCPLPRPNPPPPSVQGVGSLPFPEPTHPSPPLARLPISLLMECFCNQHGRACSRC